jgi:hypothetical protein
VTTLAVASPRLLDALGAPPAAARLLARGHVVAFGPVPDDLAARHVVPLSDGSQEGPVVLTRDDVVALPGSEERTRQLPRFVVPAGWAQERGLPTREAGVLLRDAEPLDGATRAALGRIGGTFDSDAQVRHEVLGTPAPASPTGPAVMYDFPQPDQWAFVGIVGAVLLAFTLLVVAISLALNATESRDEAALLAALGAPPRVRRSITGWQAALLPLTGTLIGVPLGLGCAAAMAWAEPTSGTTAGVTVPWLLLAVLVVGAPVASGLAARLVAGVGGRRRPGLAASLALD